MSYLPSVPEMERKREEGDPQLSFYEARLAQRREWQRRRPPLPPSARCFCCGAPADTWDHIVRQVDGGSHDLSNLRPSCRSCNSARAGGPRKTYRGCCRFCEAREMERRPWILRRGLYRMFGGEP